MIYDWHFSLGQTAPAGGILFNDNPTGQVLALGEDGVIEIDRIAPKSGATSRCGRVLAVPQLREGHVAGYRV